MGTPSRAAAARHARSVLFVLPLLACGPDTDSSLPAVDAAPPALVAGQYHVEGLTTAIESGESREIAGTVIFAQEGDAWTATFDLKTIYPSADGPLDAEVIGTGEGTIAGTELRGRARTQILAGLVPGVDPGFPFLPRTYGPRILSDARATLHRDGTLEFHITSRADEGERYTPTETRLRGVRAP